MSDYSQQTSNSGFNLNDVRNAVYCSQCGTRVGSTEEGFASCVCFVCSSANDGMVLTPEALRAYMQSLPPDAVNYVDLSHGKHEQLKDDDSVVLNGKKLTFGEKLYKALTINRPRKTAPNRASIEQVKSKQRRSLFENSVGGDMAEIDAALKKEK